MRFGVAGRIVMFVAGAFLAERGFVMMQRGVYLYQNITYRTMTYAPATIASGLLMVFLAFVPIRLVKRWAEARRPKAKIHPDFHRHHLDDPNS